MLLNQSIDHNQNSLILIPARDQWGRWGGYEREHKLDHTLSAIDLTFLIIARFACEARFRAALVPKWGIVSSLR